MSDQATTPAKPKRPQVRAVLEVRDDVHEEWRSIESVSNDTLTIEDGNQFAAAVAAEFGPKVEFYVALARKAERDSRQGLPSTGDAITAGGGIADDGA